MEKQQAALKKTVVLGASPNPDRYAYRATLMLQRYGHQPVPVGIRRGEIGGLVIRHDLSVIPDVDTVTLYMRAERQRAYYDYIFSLHPKRILFNPGAENDELAAMARARGIETVEGCTLVMLSLGNY